MKNTFVVCCALICVFVLAFTVAAKDATVQFIMDVGNHFNADYELVNEIHTTYVTTEELPVAFFIAEQANASVLEVAKTRADGNTWVDVATSFNVTTDAFYVMTSKKSKSNIYNDIFNKFASTPKNKWRSMDLSDAEIINLANLRFIYKQHDYNPYVVMSMRDYGKSFVKINSQIKELKEKLLEQQVAQAEEAQEKQLQ